MGAGEADRELQRLEDTLSLLVEVLGLLEHEPHQRVLGHLVLWVCVCVCVCKCVGKKYISVYGWVCVCTCILRCNYRISVDGT